MALRARWRNVVSGDEELIGSSAVVLDNTRDKGWARVRGENLQVNGKAPLRRGQNVGLIARKGLVLEVAPAGNALQGQGE